MDCLTVFAGQIEPCFQPKEIMGIQYLVQEATNLLYFLCNDSSPGISEPMISHHLECSQNEGIRFYQCLNDIRSKYNTIEFQEQFENLPEDSRFFESLIVMDFCE